MGQRDSENFSNMLAERYSLFWMYIELNNVHFLDVPAEQLALFQMYELSRLNFFRWTSTSGTVCTSRGTSWTMCTFWTCQRTGRIFWIDQLNSKNFLKCTSWTSCTFSDVRHFFRCTSWAAYTFFDVPAEQVVLFQMYCTFPDVPAEQYKLILDVQVAQCTLLKIFHFSCFSGAEGDSSLLLRVHTSTSPKIWNNIS